MSARPCGGELRAARFGRALGEDVFLRQQGVGAFRESPLMWEEGKKCPEIWLKQFNALYLQCKNNPNHSLLIFNYSIKHYGKRNSNPYDGLRGSRQDMFQ